MLTRLFDADELKKSNDKAARRARGAEVPRCGSLQRADVLYYTGAAFQGALLVCARRRSDRRLRLESGEPHWTASCPAQVKKWRVSAKHCGRSAS